jgi:acetyl esterase/lipase
MTLRHALAALPLTLCLTLAAHGDDRPVVSLWPDVVPGSEGKSGPEKVRISDGGDHVVSSVHRPTLTVFLPVGRSTGAGVIVLPGGGHRELWVDHEGYDVARWLAERGIAAFVLKYRLARETGSTYQVQVESLQDAQRALQLVRSQGAKWSVDPARLGVIGFSAGGELAALVASRNDAGRSDSLDPVEREGSRPAFQALVYPGNSKAIAPAKESPPAFLVCGANDRPDISEGLASVYLLFKQAQVPVELHIYAGTGHGFGLRASNHLPSAGWPDRFREWLDGLGFLKERPQSPPAPTTTKPAQ